MRKTEWFSNVRKLIFLFFIFQFISGCTYDVELKPIDNRLLFHDGNSKVWLIESGIKSKGLSNVDFRQKEIIIFYQSGKCYIQKVAEFTKLKPRVFDFERIDKEDGKHYLLLVNKHKRVKYEIVKMTNDCITLTEKNKSGEDHIFELLPFPEY